MTKTLNDLFEQIIHSERKAQERKNYLQDVKSKLVTLEEEFAESQDEHKRLKGQLLLKVQRWKQEELKVTFLTSRQGILLEQKQALEKDRDDINTQLKQVQTSRWTMMTSLCSEIESFNQNYDLLSMGSVRREKEARKQAEQLKDPEKVLAQELDIYEKKLSAVQKLEDEHLQLKKEKEERRLESSELDEEISMAKDTVTCLERDKSQITSQPITGEDFKQLHKELPSIQCDQLEAKCQTLQNELTYLQQQLRQKALQQQQQQRILHEQQRRQQKHDTALQLNDHNNSQDSVAVESCTSNKLRVTNFSSNSKESYQSQKSTRDDCIDLADDDFSDDMYLPDLTGFNTEDDNELYPNRTQQRKAIFKGRKN